MDTKTTPEVKDDQTKKPAETSPDTKAENKDAKKKKKEKEDGQTIQKLQTENENLNHELADAKDQYTRMLAEYANYKRRTEQEKEQLGSFTKAETIKLLLPVLDNLERAVDAPPGDDYKAGVEMIIRQLKELLESQGLEAIDAKGAAFDPEIHNAVMREDAEGVEPETVTEVFQKGYKIADRILRPAMVKVAN